VGFYDLTSRIVEALDSKDVHVQSLPDHNGMHVWLVDGAYIRNHIDEEFTNFGQPRRFHFIPFGEFWIDQETTQEERTFFIQHMAAEYTFMKQGLSYSDANARADAEEKQSRTKQEEIRPVNPVEWFTTPQDQNVLLVDGEAVRNKFDVEFTEGGNGYRYEFIPKNEIWIEKDLDADERIDTLGHEWFEVKLMKKGETYDQAHQQASHFEEKMRKNDAFRQELINFLDVPTETKPG
jgi:hypothetical protein